MNRYRLRFYAIKKDIDKDIKCLNTEIKILSEEIDEFKKELEQFEERGHVYDHLLSEGNTGCYNATYS